MSSLPRASSLLFFCLALLSLSFSSAQRNVSSVIIYSASGCLDVGNVTTDCSFPASIALQTSGFDALQLSNTYVVLSGPGALLYGVVQSLSGPLNDTVTFTLQPQGYTPSLLGALLSIQLLDVATDSVSQPFVGLSLASGIPAPALQSISGCQGSGAATQLCVPDATTLVLTGSGLSWLAGGYYSLCVAGACSSISVGPGGAMSVLNDSYAVLALNQCYVYLLLPSHYGDLLLPLYFSLPVWNYCQQPAAHTCPDSLFLCIADALLPPSPPLVPPVCCLAGRASSQSPYVTNAVNISFVPLPPPSVTSVYSQGCNGSSSAPFTQCVPLGSTIVFNGAYLYEAQISVGGVPCNKVSATAVGATCNLPLIPGYAPGQLYDVLLVNSAGSLSLPALVSFVGGVLLIGMTQCVNYGIGLPRYEAGGACQPGTPVTISGVGFYPDPSMQIVYSTPGNTANISCLQPAFINSTTLSCTLPTAATSPNLPIFLGSFGYLQVSFNNSAVLSNSVYLLALDWPEPPIVSLVAGACAASNGALAVSGCAMGSLLTLYGSNLNGSAISIWSSGSGGAGLGFFYFLCELQPPVTPSSITCLLPAPGDEITGIMQPNVSYKFAGTLVDSLGRNRRLNTFSVSFAPAAPALRSTVGSSTDRSAILIGVIVPVVVLLLLPVTVLLWRRWQLVKRADSSSASGGGERFEHFTDVEMK